MEYKFCPVCGGELVAESGYPRCPIGHYTFVPWQNVGVAAIICKDGAVLLEQRAFGSAKRLWALPGGMLEFGEQTEEGLAREVLEETGISVQVGKLLEVMGGQRVCIVFYEAIPTGGELAKSDESLDVQWFALGTIPWEHMAFPRHATVLRDWIRDHSQRMSCGDGAGYFCVSLKRASSAAGGFAAPPEEDRRGNAIRPGDGP